MLIYNVCREATDAENCRIGTETSRESEEAGISESEEARTPGNNINRWNFFKGRQRWQEEAINKQALTYFYSSHEILWFLILQTHKNVFADVKDLDGFYHCALAFWHHYINRQVRIKETKEEKDKLLLAVAFCVMGFANITSSKVRKHCLIKLFKQTHVRSLAIKSLTILVLRHCISLIRHRPLCA